MPRDQWLRLARILRIGMVIAALGWTASLFTSAAYTFRVPNQTYGFVIGFRQGTMGIARQAYGNINSPERFLGLRYAIEGFYLGQAVGVWSWEWDAVPPYLVRVTLGAWLPLFILVAISVFVARIARCTPMNRCGKCDYDLRALESRRCPECGQSF